MSDPRHTSDVERAAALADRLIRSAEKDGLDDARLAALGQRLFGAKAAASVKIPIVAILLGGVATLGGAFAYSRGDADTGAPLVSAQPLASADPASEPPAAIPRAADGPSATVAVALLPDAPPPPRAPHVRGESPPPPSASTADMQAELLALERVHTAVSQNRITDAKSALATYERSFPKKLFGQEARVLEIELLLAEGRREEADARARAFLAGAGADGPYAARVRSLVAPHRTP